MHGKEEGEREAGSGPGEGRKSCVCLPGDKGSRAAAKPAWPETPGLGQGVGYLQRWCKGRVRTGSLSPSLAGLGAQRSLGSPLDFQSVCAVPSVAGISSRGDASTGSADKGCLGPWGWACPKRSVSLRVGAAMAPGWDPALRPTEHHPRSRAGC